MNGKVFSSLAIAGAMIAATPAQATKFVTSFATNSSVTGTAGNAWTSSIIDGISVTATAWSTSTLTASPASAYLGLYTNGLGVTNSTDSSHTIDNVGSYDFVMLTFSRSVRLTDIQRFGYDVDGTPSTISTDAWISYGATAFDTAARWQGYIDRGVTVLSAQTATSSNFGSVWLVGAARTATSRDDGFKLSSVTVVTTPAVPEPTTWMTMILGFGAVGFALRRRRAAVRVTYA